MHFLSYRRRSLVACACLPLVFFCTSLTAAAMAPLRLEINNHSFSVEVASNAQQRRQGLMWRQQLADNNGMLFVYPRSGDHRIWMKNTLIPLRVIWIDEDFRVISIQRLEPCLSSPCPVYSAQEWSRYILELADRQRAIKPGDLVEGLEAVNALPVD